MAREGNYWTDVFARRLSRRRALRTAGLGGAGVAAVGVIGCGDDDDDDDDDAGTPGGTAAPTQAAGAPIRGGTLNVALSGDPPVLDPYRNLSFLTQIPTSFVYSRLLRYESQPQAEEGGAYTVVPDLAEAWEVNDEGTVWTFNLRQGVTFHNGRPFDAEDVVLSWDRWVNLPGHSRAALGMVEKVEAPDPQTVVFTLSFPYAPFATMIASPNYLWILPREASSGEIDLTQTMMGTGPFMFEEYRPGVSIRYKSNPNYYMEGMPYVDGVDAFIVPDPSTRVAQFITGKLDEIIATDPNERDDVLREVSDVHSRPVLGTLLTFIYFQALDPADEFHDASSPFNDERVRRAVSQALDRDALLTLLYKGEGRWNSTIPAGFSNWHLNPKDDDYGDAGAYFRFDPDAVEAALTEGGFEGGFDTDLHYTELYGNVFIRATEGINRMLNDQGIRSNLDPQDYRSEYITGTFLGQFRGLAYGPQSGFTEPDEYLFNMYHSQSVRNHSSVNDSELDKLIDDQRREFDAEARQEQIFEIQRYVADKMYYVPTVTGPAFHIQHPQVKNFGFGSFYGIGTESFAQYWLER